MSDKLARKRAELALLEAEAAFVEKKKSGDLTVDDKLALRELRQSFREQFRSPVENGASVDAVGSKAKVKK